MSLLTKSATQIKEKLGDITGSHLANDFEKMLNTWHSLPEIYDKEIESYIHRSKLLYIEQERTNLSRGCYTPSSASSCMRELYHKRIGNKRDKTNQQPHQGRWKKLGTMVGDLIQRDLLYIEKYYHAYTGNTPMFAPMYKPYPKPNQYKIGFLPMWEEFAATTRTFDHHGFKIPMTGQPDGILRTTDGRKIGLEIKSKQTSYSKTGSFSMRDPEPNHLKQVIGYSLLYDIDEFIILYVNASKAAWNMTKEVQTKYPDMRAFYYKVTDSDHDSLLNYFSKIEVAIQKEQPPAIDWDKWMFNNYKEATALSMTKEEIEDLESELEEARNDLDSFVPKGKQKNPPYQLRSRVETLQSAYGFVKGVIESKS